ncbi:MAG: lysophospholipid acyltransferase family protein [Sphingomicrobium sp.]
MPLLRSLLFAAIFYPATFLLVLVGLVASLFGRRPAIAVVLNWIDLNHWLCRHVLEIETRVIGSIPPGPHLIAVKHQSMFETLEMLRLSMSPIIVLKKELADLPLFGWMTRCYGVIPVERGSGAKALRELVFAGKDATASGRPILIFPEGTRVAPGGTPPLRPGFAGLYRALGLPVVPVAVDSGRLWGRGLVKRNGIVTFLVGETIPPGLKREDIEGRVHRAINALELGAKARA